jgi:hypothetical protein
VIGLGHPSDWIKLQLLGPLDGKSRIQNQEESSQLNWIQAIGLKNQNQAETPDLKNPVDWMVF